MSYRGSPMPRATSRQRGLMQRVNRMAHAALAGIGVHGIALRARDRQQARRALRRDPHRIGPDGLAIPPDELIAQVSGVTTRELFLSEGALAVDIISGALARAGVRIEQLDAILDFGV